MTGDGGAAARTGPSPSGLRTSARSLHAPCRPAHAHAQSHAGFGEALLPRNRCFPCLRALFRSRLVSPGRAGTPGPVCRVHGPTSCLRLPPCALAVTSGPRRPVRGFGSWRGLVPSPFSASPKPCPVCTARPPSTPFKASRPGPGLLAPNTSAHMRASTWAERTKLCEASPESSVVPPLILNPTENLVTSHFLDVLRTVGIHSMLLTVFLSKMKFFPEHTIL